MNRLSVFSFLIFLFLISCSSDNMYEAFSEIETGTINGDSYTNQSLGMTMNVPLGWVVKKDGGQDSGPGASSQAQRLKRRKRLFFICKEAENCNNSMLGVVQDTSYARGANTTQKYYEYLENRNGDLQNLGIKADFKRSEAEIGGRDFNMLSVKRHDKEGRPLNLEKEIYFLINGSTLMEITLNFESETDKNLLKKTLGSIKFEK